jgi:hypothetical protein
MASKQCEKCGEMVDEAKAFCPGCGNAFVEEEKREASKFEKLDPTMQFGHTMYNQLLEDMGLNISNSPNPGEKRVEVLAPVNTKIVPPTKAAVTVTVPPAVKTPEKSAAPSSNLKWYILIGAAVVFLLPIALVSAVLVVLDIWSRLK